MTKAVDEAMIRRVADLARLELSEEEKKEAQQDLQNVLAFMEVIRRADIPAGQDSEGEGRKVQPLREDVVSACPFAGQILAQAPVRQDDCPVVPCSVAADPALSDKDMKNEIPDPKKEGA